MSMAVKSVSVYGAKKCKRAHENEMNESEGERMDGTWAKYSVIEVPMLNMK